VLHLAAHIITSKSGHFDPAQFEDRYETTLVELLKKKPVKNRARQGWTGTARGQSGYGMKTASKERMPVSMAVT
jgi:non-homologous end joining protein Ku